ncbi:hypothetical protein MHYP_G00246610 [Metynnis hypsauchen]
MSDCEFGVKDVDTGDTVVVKGEIVENEINDKVEVGGTFSAVLSGFPCVITPAFVIWMAPMGLVLMSDGVPPWLG